MSPSASSTTAGASDTRAARPPLSPGGAQVASFSQIPALLQVSPEAQSALVLHWSQDVALPSLDWTRLLKSKIVKPGITTPVPYRQLELAHIVS